MNPQHRAEHQDHRVVNADDASLARIIQTLELHPGVKRAAATTAREMNGHARLAAYVEFLPETDASERDLMQFLVERLPSACLPDHVIVVDRLPFDAGELDSAALPQPPRCRDDEAVGHPRSSLEALLCEIWRTVLQLDRVGVHDNFFSLGGHSLNAAQVIARIRDAMGISVPLRALFDAPTVAELSQRIGEFKRLRSAYRSVVSDSNVEQ